MESISYNHLDAYKEKRQLLGSLVLNPPLTKDLFTTSPKIEKIFTFPYGVQIEASILSKFIYKFLLNVISFLAVATFAFTFIYIPIQKENQNLLVVSRSLSNKQYTLLATSQEVSTYKKLFEVANYYSLAEPKEIIKVRKYVHKINKENNFKKSHFYPKNQYSGF